MMKKIKTTAVLLLLLMLAACSSGREQQPSETEEMAAAEGIRIGVTLASDTASYQVSTFTYMLDEANRNDVELLVEYADWDPQLQAEHIDGFIREGVDVIILCPTDAKSMLTPLKKAKEAGVPVINLNMKVDAISTEYVETYVGSSSSEEAALAAEMFVGLYEEYSEGRGIIGIIEGSPGSDPQIYRTQTFIEQLASHPDIEVAGIGNGEWSRDKARYVAMDLIGKNPDLTGIFCHDSNMAMGAIEAIERMDLEQEIYVIGISEGEEYLEAVKEGRLYGLITQPPEYEGRTVIQCAMRAAKGESLRPWYKDPIETVTGENVAGYRYYWD